MKNEFDPQDDNEECSKSCHEHLMTGLNKPLRENIHLEYKGVSIKEIPPDQIKTLHMEEIPLGQIKTLQMEEIPPDQIKTLHMEEISINDLE